MKVYMYSRREVAFLLDSIIEEHTLGSCPSNFIDGYKQGIEKALGLLKEKMPVRAKG